MFRWIKYRAYPEPDEEVVLDAHRHNARLIRNLALEHRQLAWKHRKVSVSSRGQAADIKELAAAYDWLAVTPQQVLQQAAALVDDAFERFWSGQNGYPARARKSSAGSFVMPQRATFTKSSRRWGTVTLPGAQAFQLGRRRLRVRVDRPLPGRATGRISYAREADGTWWVSILCEVRDRFPTKHRKPGTAVGNDMGVAVAVATSDDESFTFSAVTAGEVERMRRLDQQLARQRTQRKKCKRKGPSRNERKTLKALNGIKARARRRRHDFAHQVSSSLVRDYELIGFENLNIAGMTASAAGTVEEPGTNVRQKAGLNREILNVGWGEIQSLTVQKANNHGSHVIKVPAPGTSQTCPDCGHRDPKSRVTRSRFVCTACGYVGHADHGAAKIVKKRMLKIALAKGIVLGVTEGTPVTACDPPKDGSVETPATPVDRVEPCSSAGREAGIKLTGHQTEPVAA